MAAAETPIAVFVKTPTGNLDYVLDWRQWLAGDRISSITVANDSAGTLVISQTAFGSGVVIAWASVGTAGVSYMVGYTITTVGGRVDKRSIQIQVRER